jgi:hypothetical protein
MPVRLGVKLVDLVVAQTKHFASDLGARVRFGIVCECVWMCVDVLMLILYISVIVVRRRSR